MSKNSKNMYDVHPVMIDSGSFWRCDHGYSTFAGKTFDCWRCGLWRPVKFFKIEFSGRIKHWWKMNFGKDEE